MHDELPAARATAFSESALDRRAELREGPDALGAALAHPQARVLVFTGDHVVAKRTKTSLGVTFTRERAVDLGADEARGVLLGWDAEGAPWIATPVHGGEEAPTWVDVEMIGVRALLVEPTLDRRHMGPVAEGRSLLDWHARHGFCARCGTPTAVTNAGWRRRCAKCEAEHFPRVDPVAIMLVTHDERCLLGRQPRMMKGMYTCLAGFMEPGETVEDAVRREVREESGVDVGAVRYHASQPWPFPSSLMIGCHAEATSTAIVVDQQELEDCRWFERNDVAKMCAKQHPDGFWVPMKGTLSRELIDAWV